MSESTSASPCVYEGLAPGELWRHFAALNGIPRPSRLESRAADYVRKIADDAGVRSVTDAFGNVVAYLPPSPGREAAPVVAIQAHLDMVCEKRPEVPHDFAHDAIRPRRLDGWIYATGTTLGADNGIGAAAALALITDREVTHGPLELVFTLQEEIGLLGAGALDPSLLSSRRLVNLDSEDPRELTIGCAGGGGATLNVAAARERAPSGWCGFAVRVSGAKGGHSGVQIHERLANAIKLVVRCLTALEAAGIAFRLVRIDGGNARNAIPRDAEAVIAIPGENAERLEEVFRETHGNILREWSDDEPRLQLACVPESARESLSPELTRSIVGLLAELPHGVLAMSRHFPGKVETSANLAMVRSGDAGVEIVFNTRSFIPAELGKVLTRARRLGEEHGAAVQAQENYPAWKPDDDSRLLRVAKRVYTGLFDRAPEVQVIHAGLECGIIAAKHPGMEAISFGPRIEGAHTPEERVLIASVADTWRLLVGLLDEVSRPAGEPQS